MTTRVPPSESTTLRELQSARFSVVIVSHDSVKVLACAARSVARLLPAAEIVVVENGDTDCAFDTIRRLGVAAETIRLRQNLGFGAGCNVGAAASHGEFIFFLNPDAIVAEIDPARLNSSLARQPFGLVAATALSSAGTRAPLLRPDRRWRGEIAAYLATCFLKPSWLPAIPFEATLARGDAWASGAAMLVRRDEFVPLGGFDERLFLYHGVRDLSRRYRRAGYAISSSPGLVVRHTPSFGSDVREPFRIACALLSAIEMAEIWEGHGCSAARVVSNSLQAIESLTTTRAGRSLSLVARKSYDARAVRRALRSVLAERPAQQYPNARRALTGRTRHCVAQTGARVAPTGATDE